MQRKLYANIIVDISQEKLDRTFSYLVPDSMQNLIHIGDVVAIPFGKGNRLTKGYVVELTGITQYEESKMKSIQEILVGTEQTTGEDRLITLAAWMRDTYGSTMIQALKTVIPIKKKVKPKEKKTLVLLLSENETEEKLKFYEKKSQRARYRLLKALREEKEIPYDLATGKLNITSATVRGMEEQGILKVEAVQVYRNPLHQREQEDYTIRLNPEQQRITDAIWQEKQHRVSLIFGVTGSGKTEVYMELIAQTIEKGRQAIVLIPEISLTYQTVMRFYRRFGDRISIIHSRLSAGEKYDQFQRAKNGDIDIMIGPRSALFTPFSRLGLIIIDEEHESSYKSETTPRYHAREVAIQRAELEDAKVVLGSATPSLEAYYRAKKGEYALYTLDKRARSRSLPDVDVVDMREELKNGNRSVISAKLREEIQLKLDAGEQIMLFLNRRGYAGFLSCRACGHVLICPHCDVSLSVHNYGRMICHYCGYEEKRPEVCPKCGSSFISTFGIGTQQVELVVKKMFPQSEVLRMDMDTTRAKDGHEKILSAFQNQEADILIGTQMIVKGHDFPNVTLVGILAADLSLHADDYKAGERTFQLLTQAAGRAGRGEKKGNVIIQTYDPDHYCITSAAKQDYLEFYGEEMSYRMLADYPPAVYMMSLHGTGKDEQHLQMAMEYLVKMIQRMPENQKVRIFGPVQESIGKIQDEYRKVIYLKAEQLSVLTGIKNKLEKYMELNEGYRTVMVQFDLND